MDTNFNELLEKARKHNKNPGKPQIERFIEEKNIQRGSTRIHNYIIYYTYRKLWDSHLPKFKRIEFFRRFSKNFESGRFGKQRFYLLNPEPFDLSREGKLEAKHYAEKDWKRVKDQAAKRKASKSKKEPESES